MANFPTPPGNTRLGFHYFPDAHHYRESDLHAWLPELKALGASWLVLLGPAGRAIPEYFLSGLLAAGIEPVLHLPLPVGDPSPARDLEVLFHTYARWGLHYLVPFDRPNSRISWPSAAWAQSDLVERFLDRFIPVARIAVQAGLNPVFPPLEPGGGYWDTAFLRVALQGIERRGLRDLLDRLVLSAQASSGERPLNWGSGGPERWPDARPYFTPPGIEDQRGFHIFDWYAAIARAATGRDFAFLLLAAGSHSNGRGNGKGPRLDEGTHARRNLAIAAAVIPQEAAQDPKSSGVNGAATGQTARLDPVPPAVLAVNYWLLAAEPGSPHAARAWFYPDGTPRPAAIALRNWANRSLGVNSNGAGNSSSTGSPKHPLTHYLLLPAYDWGVTDWHLNLVRPFIKKHRPAVGFSLAEAACASRVTVIGGPHEYPDSALDQLRRAGCMVERVTGSGTNIATQLADM
jgi:hypothetical protein